MPLYAAICLYHPPHSAEKRDEFRTACSEYVAANDTMVGPLMDGEGNPCASFQVLEAENAAEVGHWLAQEPIVRESVHRDALVGKFFVSKNDLPRQDWSGAGS